ncbi:DUF637 domain-containing protein [Pseudomonas solani]|nr:DUF637 domain-containing protein [Pseudomonas solani]
MHQESHEKSKSSFVWNSMEGKGKTDETVLQSQLIAQGEIAIKAVDGLKIDIKEINQQSVSQTVDAMVAADPQLAWLKDVEQRGDVDWRRVKEVHDSFKYSHSGLGGGAAIIIAIIVAYFTAGAASGLIGTAASAGAGSGSAMAAAGSASMVSAGTAVGTAGAGWANVALTSVATSAAGSAAVSTVNNRGNLGAVVKDITSKDAMRGYVVTGVTAGLTAGIYDKWTGTNTAPSTSLPNSGAVTAAGGLGTWEGVGRFTANQMLQNGTSTLVDRALGGDAKLSDALRSSLASAFAAAGFNWVGDKTSPQQWDWKDGSLPKVGLHALMGGLAAEAAGGDFKTGALVAGLNEAVVDKLAGVYDQMDPEEKKRLLVMNSQVLGVLVAASQGGDEKSLQTGAWVAGNATQYNYLTHKEVEEKSAREKACPDQKCVMEVREQYADLDEGRNKKLASVCQDNPKSCQQILDQLIKDDPKILEFSRQVAKEGNFNEALGIAIGIRGSNQDAQSIIVRELSMLKNGGDSGQFLADLAAKLLDAATGGGGRTAPARGVHTPVSKDTSPISKEAAAGLEKKFGDALDAKEVAGTTATGGTKVTATEGTFPDEVFAGKKPHQTTPGIGSVTQERYNPVTGQLEKSVIEYDQYGRQVKRTDYTNHGYGNPEKPAEYHSDPHTHIYEYGPGYGANGKETRINND